MMQKGKSPESIVHVRDLTKAFDGATAVEDICLDVPAGAIFGFVGPSGCGKTTSVRLMLGIYTPDSGDVRVLQCSPREFGQQERMLIGYMPQQFMLYPELTVWENLNFAASLYGVPVRRKERLHDLLELVELSGHEKKLVRDLSGGMQRRLGLAAAIVHQPTLVFLDEPTAGIDPVLRRKFWDYFQELKQDGCTLLVTTQYVGEAANCDYVGVMADGRLLSVDTPTGLRRRALGGDILHLHTGVILSESQLDKLRKEPFVLERKVSRLRGREVEISVDDASAALPLLLAWCQNEQLSVESASEYVPAFDDVFVKLISREAVASEVADV